MMCDAFVLDTMGVMRNQISKMVFWAAAFYLGLGLLSGLFYREWTRGTEHGGLGATQLSVTHTHALTLGFIVMLIVLLLNLSLGLESKAFSWFFWVYNIGVFGTWATLFVRGFTTTLGQDLGGALSGIAGLTHILVSIGLVILMVIVGQRLKASGAITGR